MMRLMSQAGGADVKQDKVAVVAHGRVTSAVCFNRWMLEEECDMKGSPLGSIFLSPSSCGISSGVSQERDKALLACNHS